VYDQNGCRVFGLNMNTRVLDLFLAVLLFAGAYYAFDRYSPTHFTISLVLCLIGTHSLFRSSESARRQQMARSCLRAAAILSVFLILKVVIFG
jgi:hypothetical protein